MMTIISIMMGRAFNYKLEKEGRLWMYSTASLFAAHEKMRYFILCICQGVQVVRKSRLCKDASNHKQVDQHTFPIDRDPLANQFHPIRLIIMPPVQGELSLCPFADLAIPTMAGC